MWYANRRTSTSSSTQGCCQGCWNKFFFSDGWGVSEGKEFDLSSIHTQGVWHALSLISSLSTVHLIGLRDSVVLWLWPWKNRLGWANKLLCWVFWTHPLMHLRLDKWLKLAYKCNMGAIPWANGNWCRVLACVRKSVGLCVSVKV